ncbi:MAG: VOC family protein [Deinococcus-Thermus bacterium]|jgi:predicted enzyme related to lactoylglutathione lyase|nr:VOC family protein [Deinococcota bacterium]
MGRVTHFEIHADDPQRAMAFYGELLGWSFHPWGDIEYWLTETGPPDEPGINGAVMRRSRPVEGEGIVAYVCTAAVEDVDAALAKVRDLGGAVVQGKTAVPGVGWHAYVEDTEGNLFALMQEDGGAA